MRISIIKAVVMPQFTGFRTHVFGACHRLQSHAKRRLEQLQRLGLQKGELEEAIIGIKASCGCPLKCSNPGPAMRCTSYSSLCH